MRFIFDSWFELNELIMEPFAGNIGREYGERKLTNILVRWGKGTCKNKG